MTGPDDTMRPAGRYDGGTIALHWLTGALVHHDLRHDAVQRRLLPRRS